MAENSVYEPLTGRETQILALIAEGLHDKEIAERLVVATTTVKWYNRQIFNKLGVDNRRRAIQTAKALGLLNQSETPKHNLPASTTPFVGRIQEVADITLLLRGKQSRLVTILAPGGMGKTRLALVAAEEILRYFSNGVYVVPLVGLTAPDHIIPAVAECTGFQFFPDNRTPKQQLLDYLREKSLLLILDNFEHLLEGATLVSDILQAAPGVKIIVTSRERLNLSGETVYPLVGMDYPESIESENVLNYSAVQLFVQCARQSQPQFATDNMDDVVRVCQMVQGMPLAIELAAAWVGVLSPAEIAAEISRNLDFLRTSMRDMPERLRSVRAVFESSWQQLTEEERSAYRRLSVFRGGCTREAAQEIVDTELQTLTELINKALLWRNPAGRYEVHELLRQYAEQELEAMGEADAARDAHMGYYARFADEWCRALKSPKQLVAVNTIETDIENIRQAFARAVDQSNLEMIEQFTEMWYYYSIRGWYPEGATVLGAAADKLKPHESITLGKLLAGQAEHLVYLGMLEQANECALQSLDILHRCGAIQETVLPLFEIGRVAASRDGIAKSKPSRLEALRIAEQYDDQWGRAIAICFLGRIAFYEKSFSQARDLFNQSYAIMQSMGNDWAMSIILIDLGDLAYNTANYAEAERRYEESLTIARKIRQRFLIAICLSGLAGVAIMRGQFAKARRFAEESLQTYRDVGVYQAAAITKAHLGQISCAMGNYQEAGEHLREAVQLAGDYKNFNETISVLLNILLNILELFATLEWKKEQAAELVGLIEKPPNLDKLLIHSLNRLQKNSDQLRAELSPEVYTAAWERGQALNWETAVEEILAELST